MKQQSREQKFKLLLSRICQFVFPMMQISLFMFVTALFGCEDRSNELNSLSPNEIDSIYQNNLPLEGRGTLWLGDEEITITTF